MNTYLGEEQKRAVYAYFGQYFNNCLTACDPVDGQADHDLLTIDCGGERLYMLRIRKEAAEWSSIEIRNGLTRRDVASKIVEAGTEQILEWPNRADLTPSRAALHESRESGKG